MEAAPESPSLARWELFKLLGEASRLRLLALAAEEELAIGELAELLRESQPNVSRHVKPLRQAGLLTMRKEGTRVLVRLANHARADAVVAEALVEGRVLAAEDGSLARISAIVREREHQARAFFDADARDAIGPAAAPPEFGAYLHALGALLPHRALAVDVGTGDGRLLEALAPVFDRVVAVDRSATQLKLAATRVRERGFTNVDLVNAELGDGATPERVRAAGGADAVFVSRVLHHVASPAAALKSLASWVAPHGSLVVVDYVAHDDEAMRERVADVWLGFEASELVRLAHEAGLDDAHVHPLPGPFRGDGPDAHLDWQLLVARRSVRARR